MFKIEPGQLHYRDVSISKAISSVAGKGMGEAHSLCTEATHANIMCAKKRDVRHEVNKGDADPE